MLIIYMLYISHWFWTLLLGKPFEKTQKLFLGPRPLGIWWHFVTHRIILNKTRSCLWKSEIGFWSYGLVNHLGAIGPKHIFRLQNLSSRYFLILYNFIVFNLWFRKKWDPVCEKQIYGSQAFQWIFCTRAIDRPCKEVFSQIARAIYCPP